MGSAEVKFKKGDTVRLNAAGRAELGDCYLRPTYRVRGLAADGDLRISRGGKVISEYAKFFELAPAAEPQAPTVPKALPVSASVLPVSASDRKAIPMVRGLLDYFPAALAEVAKVSKAGNDQHNPGEEMHHARGKSTDHADCIVRHTMERGTIDTDGQRHSAKAAWRALALLQEEMEQAGLAPLARGARL